MRELLRRQVETLHANEPAAGATREEWDQRRGQLREQLFDMLGLAPRPPRGDLQATITGQLERDGVIVERLHFQSIPGLYVTGNFYRPAGAGGRLPTILYVCGHGRTKIDGVSYGNKVNYQHHGCWFAQHGYNCLTIDTVQLGELEGEHHGTYRLGRWWWIARGYTPAGVEAWNSIRALDYLESRPDVDTERLGVTGRSGGGAYSWWLAALDDRPACIAPVAGITDLQNHVVDNCIEGHCDCMYMVNYYGWDFATLACLAAPRPLLLCNTDSDRIFPLSGVERIHGRLRDLYASYGAADKLGLFISPGPHADTQELQLGVFRWMNHYLRGDDSPVSKVAEKLFTPAELKVFAELPADERNTSIDETFVPMAELGPPPASRDEWEPRRQALLDAIQARSVRGDLPSGDFAGRVAADATAGGLRMRAIECQGDHEFACTVYAVSPASASTEAAPRSVVLNVIDDTGWREWRARYASRFAQLLGPPDDSSQDEQVVQPTLETGEISAVIAPRGWGPHAWLTDEKTQTHLPRRFVLVGTTVDEGRINDVRRAVRALRGTLAPETPVTIAGRGPAAAIALYAGLFEPAVGRFDLDKLASDPHDGPVLLGIERVLTMPAAVALALPRPVRLRGVYAEDWNWSLDVARLYGEPPLRVEATPPGASP
ncbi:MAG: alpha/beta hydrolase [Pirellulales bacterium]